MTSPSRHEPFVRPVNVRLSGDDATVRFITQLLTDNLPALSGGRIQAGHVSRPYPNRSDPGSRVYLDLYVRDEQEAT
ncbi:hypothetical protein [Thermomonospora umbrina]|uniref:Uncharacterized protein n=1 Tax=Thermomonospora umbrina TaxID=111806 RepID=A0A3D9T6M9_9ACTN|nr:hypothetical protein [Thermomonospora umbrina]REF00325.1 hypothetical protein DFJ69_5857 [Thermomonospora umbrina]